jgi:hypothetical protein
VTPELKLAQLFKKNGNDSQIYRTITVHLLTGKYHDNIPKKVDT